VARLQGTRAQNGSLRIATVAVIGAAAVLAGVLIPHQILAMHRAASAAPAQAERSALASGCCLRRAPGHRVSVWQGDGRGAPR
jgi:hypothetical protein